METRQAHDVRSNRRRGESDDDSIQEWEQLQHETDELQEEWMKKVESSKPDVETDQAVLDIKKLRGEVGELKKLIEGLKGATGNGEENGGG